MTSVDFVKMHNGVELPLLGIGTYLAKDEESLDKALREALDYGYRYIDTATVYENEHVIGNVLHDYFSSGKLKRENVFLTTKLPIYGINNPEKYINESLKKFQTDYIDLYLIHGSYPVKAENYDEIKNNPEQMLLIPHIDTWKILEKYYKNGKFKSIGLSNFDQKQIQNIVDNCEILPHNLQIELHLYNQQHDLVDYCKSKNITVTGYAPIGSPEQTGNKHEEINFNPLEDSLVIKLADKYQKTPAQILIRFNYQQNLSTIPKSTNIQHIKDNFDIINFQLDDDDFNDLLNVKKQKRLFTFQEVACHPWNPYKTELKNDGYLQPQSSF